MNIIKSFSLISISCALVLSASAAKSTQMMEAKNVAKSSAKLLLQTLGKNMKMNMKKGGPLQALDFCSNQAYTLTEEVNSKLPQGVTVKRISSQQRNPLNKPTKEESEVLATFKKSLKKEGKVSPVIIKNAANDTYTFYKPLIIKKQVCLKCHGTLAEGKLKSEIQNRYPHDKAMGYKMGDLRGAVVVKVDSSFKATK